MSPLAVVQFTNSAVRGGAEEHILTLLRGLDRERFTSHLVAPEALLRQLAGELPAGVETIPLTLKSPRHVGAALGLARVLRERKAAVLHSHLFYSSLFSSPVGRLARVPAVIETPHLREQWRRGWFKGSFFVDRLVGRFVDRYIAVSHANAEYLIKAKRIAAGKVVVIQNGSDLRRFTCAQPPRAELRAALDIDPADPVLIVLGRLEPQKGHGVLLDAMPLVLGRFPAAKLVCLGDGSLRAELEARAAALGISVAVRFAGFQRNVEEWLRLAQVSVLPSLFEGLPLAAIESLAAGVPVVASAVDGTPEIVVDGKTGFTVPPAQPKALADAVCRVLGDPAAARELGASGRRFVQEHFDQEHQVRATERLYLDSIAVRAPALAGPRGRIAAC